MDVLTRSGQMQQLPPPHLRNSPCIQISRRVVIEQELPPTPRCSVHLGASRQAQS